MDGLADGTLVEMKCNLGVPLAIGIRKSLMRRLDVLQLIAHVLRDYDDRLGIDRVFYYQARYGVGCTWDVDYLLDQAAGQHVDLADPRDQYRQLISNAALPETRKN